MNLPMTGGFVRDVRALDETGRAAIFVRVADHDEVRRYLRTL